VVAGLAPRRTHRPGQGAAQHRGARPLQVHGWDCITALQCYPVGTSANLALLAPGASECAGRCRGGEASTLISRQGGQRHKWPAMPPTHLTIPRSSQALRPSARRTASRPMSKRNCLRRHLVHDRTFSTPAAWLHAVHTLLACCGDLVAWLHAVHTLLAFYMRGAGRWQGRRVGGQQE